jgi:hypothetical protein
VPPQRPPASAAEPSSPNPSSGWLPDPHAVLGDLDALALERVHDHGERRSLRVVHRPALDAADRDAVHAARLGQVVLTPAQRDPSEADLVAREGRFRRSLA